MQQSRQWKGKTGGGKFGQKSLFFMLRTINVSFFYPVLFVVVPFYMLFGREGYIATIRYFKNCYGFSTWKSFWHTYKNHFIFGQVVLDKFAVWSGREDQFEVEVSGNEYIQDLFNKNTGFIIASSHIGNFELGGFAFKQDKKKLYGLVYSGETQELQKNRIEATQKSNMNLISVKEDMSHLFLIKEILERGDILTIPCDRIYGSPKKIKCEFFNRDAYFPFGPFRLAVQMDVPIVALFVMKNSWKKYHAYVCPVNINTEEQNPVKKANTLACYFVNKCEEILRKYPQQWFNYYNFWKN
ncbi:MAG: lysophospholipid acyltransferase family protein [Bacteroidales bacterium]|jgi:predicted LPLAT superfamily acyltransferase|nr:lysophospholipid acyltransferase family protein [Bacteroidales bacterium]